MAAQMALIKNISNDPLVTYEDIVATIMSHFRDDRFVAIASLFSGGKDSSLMTACSIEALKRLKSHGEPLKPLLVMSSNTRIENPLVSRLVTEEMKKIQAFSDRHDLPVVTIISKPNRIAAWVVKIIAGQGIIPLPGGKSWCTEDWKIHPLEIEAKRWLKNSGLKGELLKLTGTRFSESNVRKSNMRQRGESSKVAIRNKKGEWILSPIADLETDDVWEMAGFIQAGALPQTYSDWEGLFEVYRQAGGSECVLVADMRLKDQEDRGSCSARTGCSLCTKVATDKSLLNMLEDHPELSGLYALREYVAAIVFDFSKRSWLGRTIHDGYIRISPDSFSPEVSFDLLRFVLSIDADERERARTIGADPLFQLTDLKDLILIDFYWGLHGTASAFMAWEIFDDVVNDGNRYYPPKVVPTQRSEPPEPRYLYVGEGWYEGHGPLEPFPYYSAGLRDPLAEAFEADTPGAIPIRETNDGRQILELPSSKQTTVCLDDNAWDVLQFMLPYERDKGKEQHSSASTRFYLTTGLVKHPNHGDIDWMLKRVAFRENHGLTRRATLEDIMQLTISEEEFLTDTGKSLDNGRQLHLAV